MVAVICVTFILLAGDECVNHLPFLIKFYGPVNSMLSNFYQRNNHCTKHLLYTKQFLFIYTGEDNESRQMAGEGKSSRFSPYTVQLVDDAHVVSRSLTVCQVKGGGGGVIMLIRGPYCGSASVIVNLFLKHFYAPRPNDWAPPPPQIEWLWAYCFYPVCLFVYLSVCCQF